MRRINSPVPGDPGITSSLWDQCLRKKAYRSRQDALDAAVKTLNAPDWLERAPMMEPHECSYCHGWHLRLSRRARKLYKKNRKKHEKG
jgi:hypothetical protein